MPSLLLGREELDEEEGERVAERIRAELDKETRPKL